MKHQTCFWITLIFSLIISPAYSQSATIWQIGRKDHSSLEFTAHQKSNVLYEAGKSDWTKDWPAEQDVGATYTITFDLNALPRGTFSLDLSTLTYTPEIPSLQIAINGHEGVYYLHPKLSYFLGDAQSIFDAAYSSYDLSIDIPPQYLRQGANIISLTAVKQDREPVQPGVKASVYYDSITLSNDPDLNHKAGIITALAVPTEFYKLKFGHLVEIVEVFLRFGQASDAEDITLAFNGREYTKRIAARKSCGEERVRFEVPEWDGTRPADIKVGDGAQLSLHLSLTAARKWTLFVIPHTHLDVGYTDYRGKVAEIQARTLDEAVAMIKRQPRFRFSTDGSWSLEQFLATRSTKQQQEILGLIRRDKIGIPAQYANLLTGYSSLETLYRSFYYSHQLSRLYKLPFSYANTTDIPTYTGAYPSILASAGIKYWAAGGDDERGPILNYMPWNERSPFWWEGQDGKKVLFWYSRGYSQISFLFGLPPQSAAVYETLPIFLQAYSKPEYKPDVALIYGAQPENTNLDPEIARFVSDWNGQFAYPRLIYATFADFFRYLDKHYGNTLPTYKGDMGSYWEDGVGSDAYYTAQDRQNQNAILAAEVLSTVSHVVSPHLIPPKNEIDDIWRNIELYSEHTWTASPSVRQPESEQATKQLEEKNDMVSHARIQIEDVTDRALSQLVDQIHVPAGTLVAFNALNWKRSALVETDLDEDDELVDLTTGLPVQLETLFHKDHFKHVRFLTGDIPAVGYKCFAIKVQGHSDPGKPLLNGTPIIENQYYKITVNKTKGTIESIIDKQIHRELVEQSSKYSFGEYLYVTGGDGNTKMIHAFQDLPRAELTIHRAEKSTYLGTRRTPWGQVMEFSSSDLNTPAINLEVLLYDEQKKIEFRYHVQKDYTTAKEAVYFAFPVAVSSPTFAYASQQGWVDPAKDMFKGASLEWFSIQRWMAVRDAGLTVGIVPLDAPLACFGDINRGEWPKNFRPRSSTLFSYAMNNYWFVNYRAGQGGDFTFRYTLTSADHLDPASLSRVGWESMEPVELDRVVKQDKIGDPDRPLPASGMSFLTISAPNVVLVTWKMAEDSHGTILRLKETAGHDTEATIRIFGKDNYSVSLCDAVEDTLRSLPVAQNQFRVQFHPNEVLTIRVAP